MICQCRSRSLKLSSNGRVFSLCPDSNQKQSEEHHGKPGPQRHKPYNSSRPSTPRAPKHRLSVDANIQIPEALNSASKGDLLRRVSQRRLPSPLPSPPRIVPTCAPLCVFDTFLRVCVRRPVVLFY